MPRTLKIVMLVLAVTTTVVLLVLATGYWATRRVPQFYHEVLRVEPSRQVALGEQMEQAALELHNDVRRMGQWQAVFTDEEINGWLAVDLPRKFPQSLPPAVREPRLVFESQRTRVACRLESGPASTVLSAELEIRLGQEPNTLAVCIRRVRAGAMPVPLRQVLDSIAAAARDGGVPLRWSQNDGDPVALVTIPAKYKGVQGDVLLESVEIRDGAVSLAGSTRTCEAAGTVANQPAAPEAAGNSTIQR